MKQFFHPTNPGFVFMVLLIVVAASFLLYRAYKYYITGNVLGKLTAAFSLVGIYLLAVTSFFTIVMHEPELDFNAAEWNHNVMDRHLMGKNLLESKLLLNKDSNKILQILGQPMPAANNNYHIHTDSIWDYDMGSGSAGFGFEFHTLRLTFENGKVVGVQHHTMID